MEHMPDQFSESLFQREFGDLPEEEQRRLRKILFDIEHLVSLRETC